MTAWCERVKSEQRGLVPVASDIEFMCRAYGDSKHDSFWDFGLDRLLELLEPRFRSEERVLIAAGLGQLLEQQKREHEEILSQLYRLRQRHELILANPGEVHLAERDLLVFLDDVLSEHIFNTDAEARRLCAQLGAAFP